MIINVPIEHLTDDQLDTSIEVLNDTANDAAHPGWAAVRAELADACRAEFARRITDRQRPLRRALADGVPDYGPPSAYDQVREILAKGRKLPNGQTWHWPDSPEQV